MGQFKLGDYRGSNGGNIVIKASHLPPAKMYATSRGNNSFQMNNMRVPKGNMSMVGDSSNDLLGDGPGAATWFELGSMNNMYQHAR